MQLTPVHGNKQLKLPQMFKTLHFIIWVGIWSARCLQGGYCTSAIVNILPQKSHKQTSILLIANLESTKANGREPYSCLDQFSTQSQAVFVECNCMTLTSTPTTRVVNSAQVLSSQLKVVHVCTPFKEECEQLMFIPKLSTTNTSSVVSVSKFITKFHRRCFIYFISPTPLFVYP